MRIGIVTEYYYPHAGGVTEHVYHCARHLIARGHEVRVVTGRIAGPKHGKGDKPGGGNRFGNRDSFGNGDQHGDKPGNDCEDRQRAVPADVPVTRIGDSLPIAANGSMARATVGRGLGPGLRSLLEAERFDLLHLHSPLFPTLPLLALRYAACPVVGTLHTHFPSSPFFCIFRKSLQTLAARLDGVIAVSRNAGRSIARYLACPWTVIPNGVDTELYARGRPLAHLDDGIPKLLFVGRLDPRNRLDLLLRAFAEVRRRLGRARLVVVGDGPLRAEYASLVDPELRADVLFEGQVTGGQPDYYASADVFCFPASIASMPMTVVEAMAARRPVVAFDIDGIREVLSDGAQGLIVPDGDAHAFAAALIGLLGDARRRAAMGQAAQIAVQRYAWARLVVEVERFYEQALRRAARARRY